MRLQRCADPLLANGDGKCPAGGLNPDAQVLLEPHPGSGQRVRKALLSIVGMQATFFNTNPEVEARLVAVGRVSELFVAVC